MTWVLILFIGGILLIASEFILPGAILGIIGFCMVIASIALGWYRYPDYGWMLAVGEILGLVFTLGVGFWALANTPLKNIVSMQGVQAKEAGYSSPAQDPNLVGQTAVTHTMLRPAGTIMLGDERIDAVSNGTYIPAGRNVKIIQVEGHRVVVEEITA